MFCCVFLYGRVGLLCVPFVFEEWEEERFSGVKISFLEVDEFLGVQVFV